MFQGCRPRNLFVSAHQLFFVEDWAAWRERTVCSAAAAQDRIAAGVLDGSDNGAGWRGTLDEDKLTLQIGIYFFDA